MDALQRSIQRTNLKRSMAKMRSVHKRNEQLYKKRLVRLKRNNALLQKQVHKLTEENEMLQCELLSAEKTKSIITTKVDGKTYSTATHNMFAEEMLIMLQ